MASNQEYNLTVINDTNTNNLQVNQDAHLMSHHPTSFRGDLGNVYDLSKTYYTGEMVGSGGSIFLCPTGDYPSGISAGDLGIPGSMGSLWIGKLPTVSGKRVLYDNITDLQQISVASSQDGFVYITGCGGGGGAGQGAGGSSGGCIDLPIPIAPGGTTFQFFVGGGGSPGTSTAGGAGGVGGFDNGGNGGFNTVHTPPVGGGGGGASSGVSYNNKRLLLYGGGGGCGSDSNASGGNGGSFNRNGGGGGSVSGRGGSGGGVGYQTPTDLGTTIVPNGFFSSTNGAIFGNAYQGAGGGDYNEFGAGTRGGDMPFMFSGGSIINIPNVVNFGSGAAGLFGRGGDFKFMAGFGAGGSNANFGSPGAGNGGNGYMSMWYYPT